METAHSSTLSPWEFLGRAAKGNEMEIGWAAREKGRLSLQGGSSLCVTQGLHHVRPTWIKIECTSCMFVFMGPVN